MQRQKNDIWKEKPVGRRTYYKICLVTVKPLLIGSGEDGGVSDLSVLLDLYGQPYLPGTALAGAWKEIMRRLFGETASERLFGEPLPQKTEGFGHQSQVIVYDAVFSNAKLVFRDGVCLDAYKTAEEQAKYDMQVLLPGAKAEVILQVVQRQENENVIERENDDLKKLEQMLRYFQSQGFYIGAKKNRGFGKVKVEAVYHCSFCMALAEERKEWLKNNFRNKDIFSKQQKLLVLDEEAAAAMRLEHQLVVPLKVAQTLLVRCYPAAFSEPADYAQLLLDASGDAADRDKRPVIPGSSWIGAIRSRIAKIMMQFQTKDFTVCQELLTPVFGSWSSKEGKLKTASLVAADESVVEGAHLLPITRNSIDRFTGGTVSGSLYTGKVAVGGRTKLQLRWPCKARESKIGGQDQVILGLLLWAVRDLQEGLLAVGGETAVGRGIFEKDSANSNHVNDSHLDGIYLDGQLIRKEDAKLYMQSAASWCKEPEAFLR